LEFLARRGTTVASMKGDVMRKVLLLVVPLLFASSVAFGQAGSIGIFADPLGTDCNLVAPVSGIASFYIVHVFAANVTAAQFSAPQPSCFTCAYLSDTVVYPVTIGNSQNGISMGYGACLSSPVHVLTINYLCSVPAPECCQYPVLPDPQALPTAGIWTVDCDFNQLAATGRAGVINPTPDCRCVGAVPVDDTTWGGVKALYAPD
jgi:hypothetical protein